MLSAPKKGWAQIPGLFEISTGLKFQIFLQISHTLNVIKIGTFLQGESPFLFVYRTLKYSFSFKI